jgi:hypothetical protein
MSLESLLTDGGEFVSLTHRPPLNPKKIPGTHFCWRLSRPQGHSAAGWISQFKNLMTSSKIEPPNFHLVAYCLKQLHYVLSRSFTVQTGIRCRLQATEWVPPCISVNAVTAY